MISRVLQRASVLTTKQFRDKEVFVPEVLFSYN